MTFTFLLTPIIMPLLISFSTLESIAFPPRGFTLRWFANILRYETFTNGFIVSSSIAITSSLLALALSLPSSYILYRYKNLRMRGYVENLFTLPILMPEIVLSYILLLFVYRALGMVSLASLIIGHTLVVIPFAMRIIYASLSNLGVDVEDAAVSLGRDRLRAFIEVVLPNIKHGFVGGFLMCFMVSFNAVSISLFLSFGEAIPLPVAMLNYLQIRYDPTIAAISTLLVAFTVLLTIGLEKIVGLVSGVR
ncbi:MAG: ABC transporter permease subunit [Nitrososphaerota archaeon]|nr:ABC transporter permease subunit [Nitrososphaerota archaeon]